MTIQHIYTYHIPIYEYNLVRMCCIVDIRSFIKIIHSSIFNVIDNFRSAAYGLCNIPYSSAPSCKRDIPIMYTEHTHTYRNYNIES